MIVQVRSMLAGYPGRRHCGCSRPSAAVLLGVVALAATVLRAQPVGTESPATAPAASLPATGIEGLPGIRPGMTTAELVEAGLDALRGDRLAIGRQILLAAVAQDRRNISAVGNLGYAYERSAEQARADRNDPQAGAKADAYIQQAVDLYMEAANLALAAREDETAEQLFGRVLVHRPAMGAAVLGLARLYAITGRRLQAIDRYRVYQQTSDGRSDAKAYLELADLYLAGDLWRQALEHVARARQLDPNNPDVDITFAWAYHRAERFDEALVEAKAAVDKDPQRPRYRFIRAQVLLSAGQPEEASLEAQRAVELVRARLETAPDDVGMMRMLADYAEVRERALGALLEQRPTDTAVRVDLVRAVRDLAAIRRQIDLYRALRVLLAVPADAEPHVPLLEQLAEVQAALGKTSEAAETCRKLLAADPENAVGKRLLAE